MRTRSSIGGTTLAALVIVSGLAGCGAAGDGDALWQSLRVSGEGASEVTPPGPPEELAEVADVVVQGSFTGSCGERIVGADPGVPEQGLALLCLEFDVSEIITGEAPDSDVVRIEFPFSEGQQDDIEFPAADTVAFLVFKGESPNLYRVVNSGSMWSSTDRATVDQPLVPQPPDATSPHVGELLAGDPSWNEFTDTLRDRLTAQ